VNLRSLATSASVAALAAVLTACGGGDAASVGSTIDPVASTAAPSTTTAPAAPTSAATPTSAAAASSTTALSPLAAQLGPIYSVIPEAPVDVPRPVSFEMPSLDIDAAVVIDVGVDAVGELEVPPADQIGWYRLGSAPDQAGATVLAAHVAYDGERGVFAELTDARIGDQIEVVLSDGSRRAYEAFEVAQYAKDQLPPERIWTREGDETLVLITCGGDFDTSRSSYEDNIVVFARPA
jgi:LPXTG-site transpeptidase (sortase) family protein